MNTKIIFFGIVGIAVLAFAIYAILPLFNKIEVDDALPENIVSNESGVPSGEENLTPEEKIEMEAGMEAAAAEGPIMADDEMPSDTGTAVPETRFMVMHTAGHPAEGYVRLVPTTSGTIVRFEEYKTINGPDLHVYLAKDLKANEYVDLGKIRGTEGNINYNVPEGVDVSEYPYVLVWCEPFSVLFNYAEIN